MNLRESARFAVSGVTANKLRSGLTTLGIMIGVAAVIILVAVGTGSSKSVQDSISRLGSDTLTVRASQGGTGGRGGPGGGGGFAAFLGGGNRVSTGTQTRIASLTVDDAAALIDAELAPSVRSVAPVVNASSVTATYDGATHAVATFVGTTPSYLTIQNYAVQKGSSLTDDDYLQKRRVALLGVTVAQDLVGGTGLDAVGKSVEFNGITYTVAGVLTSKGETGFQDPDDIVLAPLTAVQDTLAGYGSLATVQVQATSSDAVSAAIGEVESILDTRHKVTAASRDYSVSSASSILSAASESNRTFTVLLGAVAAISLLVGGIGVMNIMLVTVTERTREIGIRKAIGARRGDIVSQFLFEAVLLSLFGGVMGVIVGLAGARFRIVGVQPVVAPYSVVLAFGVALLTGLFFGLYPANRAASLRPIDALRHE